LFTESFRSSGYVQHIVLHHATITETIATAKIENILQNMHESRAQSE
jgi:hypothetical protein